MTPGKLVQRCGGQQVEDCGNTIMFTNFSQETSSGDVDRNPTRLWKVIEWSACKLDLVGEFCVRCPVENDVGAVQTSWHEQRLVAATVRQLLLGPCQKS